MSPVAISREETRAPNTVLSGVVIRVKGKRIRYVPPGQVPKADPVPTVRRPAKVARLLALAHHIQDAIDRGVVADRAAAARQLGFTRARLTQLLDLTLLAPEIQEVVLELEAINGEEPTYERRLRRIVRFTNWRGQRKAWKKLSPP